MLSISFFGPVIPLISDILKPNKMILIVHVIKVIMKCLSREKNSEIDKSGIVNRQDSKRIVSLDFAMISMNALRF